MGLMECMDLDGLRTFVAIVDSMSFSRAGEALGRTQSAVSLRLRKLEESLGVSLLVRRQGRVIELTPAGSRLLAYARNIIGLNDAALRELSERDAPPRIRLGLTAGDGPADLALEWLAAADFDPGDDPAGLPLVCFPEGCVYRRAMTAALSEAGIAHHTVFTTPSLDGLRRAVGAGMGITALPASVLRLDNRLTILRGLPPLEPVSLALAVTPGGGDALRRMADFLGDGLLSTLRH